MKTIIKQKKKRRKNKILAKPLYMHMKKAKKMR
jgi:hypothetical protein